MNTPNVFAGRLERWVRRVGRQTMPDIHGFCSFYPFGAIRGGAAIAPYGPTTIRFDESLNVPNTLALRDDS